MCNKDNGGDVSLPPPLFFIFVVISLKILPAKEKILGSNGGILERIIERNISYILGIADTFFEEVILQNMLIRKSYKHSKFFQESIYMTTCTNREQ
jgi:hypothetical protein